MLTEGVAQIFLAGRSAFVIDKQVRDCRPEGPPRTRNRRRWCRWPAIERDVVLKYEVIIVQIQDL